MTAAVIYSLSPLKINSTVLAVSNLRFSPDVQVSSFRHSGNIYPSVIAVPGAQAKVTFSTPFWAAYGLIGVAAAPLKCTVVEIYLAKFTDATRSASTDHAKYALASSPGAALGFATITGARVEQNGILMADVQIQFTSYDGMTHPLLRTDAGTLPTLSSEPLLHSLGPTTINSTTYAGESSAMLDMGVQDQALATDGDLYPRSYCVTGYNRLLSIGFSTPATIWSALGMTGAAITANIVQYFREYDATTQIKKATGLSLTIASGRITPDAMSVDSLGIANAPAIITPLSSSSTDPFVFASGASIPTP